ncbi:MAG: glycogen synthase GlgA [Elusimicrobia bacterium]|nr:glycogen synthase GlgA [Elusimicrobiota bacterium]
MNILMVAAECVPFIKTGGLADVVGTLPKYLKEKGHDVRIIIPKYRLIDGAKYNLQALPYKLSVFVGKEQENFRIKTCMLDGNIPVYFIENLRYFNRLGVYGDDSGVGYGDNRERFIFFSKAAIEATKALMFRPDIIHCHDWHTGLIPAYLKTTNLNDGFFWNTSTVYTIHNIAFQGSFDAASTLPMAGFSWEDYKSDKLEFYNTFNYMKAGLAYTDIISTVSPTYAKEIQGPAGKGMEVVLQTRKNDVYGILNGIDYSYWNPKDDKNIAANFSAQNYENKKLCKKYLQEKCGFAQDEKAFMLGCVSRFDMQKGFDLIMDVIGKIANLNIQIVVLGSGDRYIKDGMLYLQQLYPNKLSVCTDYNEPLSHQIYAGADGFLMPSKFEPCGLSQIIALAYGTVPIVNKTGGLADTISNFSTENTKGNGFVFDFYKGEKFIDCILRAYDIYKNKFLWNEVVKNAFASQYSWTKSVQEYENMYTIAAKRKTAYNIYQKNI